MEYLLKEALSGVQLSQEQRERLLKNCAVKPKRKKFPYALAACACLAVAVSALTWGLPRADNKTSAPESAADLVQEAPQEAMDAVYGYSNKDSAGTAGEVIRVNEAGAVTLEPSRILGTEVFILRQSDGETVTYQAKFSRAEGEVELKVTRLTLEELVELVKGILR